MHDKFKAGLSIQGKERKSKLQNQIIQTIVTLRILRFVVRQETFGQQVFQQILSLCSVQKRLFYYQRFTSKKVVVDCTGNM